MASHHHCRNNHHSTSSCCSCSCCSWSSPPPPPPPPPSPSLPDSLLQAIASYLLQHPPPNFHLKHQYQHQQHQQQQQQQQHQNQSLFLLQSLLHRVSALESSLQNLSSPTSHSPPHSRPLSLRDFAARTIQTHFRAFLVRRSQTLRHLKHLATIKSNLTALKSSLSNTTTHFRPDALSQKATDLLRNLDSIQSRDSMIREGKKAISGELMRFLESVDGLWAKYQGVLPKSKKKVSFAEIANGNFELRGGFERVEEDVNHVEMEGFQQISNPRRTSRGEGNHGISSFFQGQNGNMILPKAEGVHYGISGNFQGENGNFDFPSMKGGEFKYGMNRVGFTDFPLPVNGEENHTSVGFTDFPFPLNGEENYASANLGLSAPVPVQMEKRGSDLLKKVRAFD